MSRLAVGAFLGILLIIGFDFAVDETIFPARLIPVYGLIASFAFLVLARNLLWILKKYLLRYGFGVRGIMIIGNTESARKLALSLKDTLTSGYNIKAIVGGQNAVPDGYKGKVYSSINDALEDLPKLGIHMVIQTQMYSLDSRNRKIFEAVRNNHLAYRFIPAQSEFYTGNNTVEIIAGFPVIAVHQTPLIGWGRVVKRVMDIILSLLGLIITSPIILIAAIAIKINDPKGPVVYKHTRITRFGTPFSIYKMRSMCWKYSTGKHASGKSAEQVFKEMGREDLAKEYKETHKVKEDPRITPVGKFIRRTSIDELPQLLNVILGHLSLVGPRAMLKKELPKYRQQAGGDVVLSVKSGVTGLWQVSGRSDSTVEERVRLELYYVQNWSLWLDFKILLKTLLVVFRGSGAV